MIQNQQYPNQYPNQQMPNQQGLMYNQEQIALASNFVANQFVVQILNPLAILADVKQAFIYQDLSTLEILGFCDVPNQYNVAVITQTGQKLMLFKCIENSGWCQRNCCPSNQAAFDMNVNTYDTMNKVAELEKPFACAYCCCCRPELTAKYTNGNVFGRVTEPCCAVKPTFHIYDANNQLKYIIKFGFCNCGCCDYSAEIYKADNEDLAIGTIIKKATLKDFFLQCTTFEIAFPNDATPDDKMLLISNVLLIDYRMFEKKQAKDYN